MQQEVLEAVMNELLQEQKIGNKKVDELIGSNEKVIEQVGEFKDHLAQVRLTTPPVNTLPLELLFAKYLDQIQRQVDEMRQFVITERKRKTIREKIFEWLPWLIIIILCWVIFRIAIGR